MSADEGTIEKRSGAELHLAPDVVAGVTGVLEDAYPREGCGVLLGDVRGSRRRVSEHVPAHNEWSERDDRYRVDPDLVRSLLESEELGGPRVLGFYHSHPDAPAVPSETDRRHGWPWYLYLIVPVEDGRAGRGRVWQFGPGDEAATERVLRRI